MGAGTFEPKKFRHACICMKYEWGKPEMKDAGEWLLWFINQAKLDTAFLFKENWQVQCNECSATIHQERSKIFLNLRHPFPREEGISVQALVDHYAANYKPPPFCSHASSHAIWTLDSLPDVLVIQLPRWRQPLMNYFVRNHTNIKIEDYLFLPMAETHPELDLDGDRRKCCTLYAVISHIGESRVAGHWTAQFSAMANGTIATTTMSSRWMYVIRYVRLKGSIEHCSLILNLDEERLPPLLSSRGTGSFRAGFDRLPRERQG